MAASTRAAVNTPVAKAPPAGGQCVADARVVGHGDRRRHDHGFGRREVDRERRHGDAVVELTLPGEELLELGLARRELGLQADDPVDVDGLGEQCPDALDAGPEVGDAAVEVGELLGHVLGQLVERRDGADLVQRIGHRRQLAGRQRQDERRSRLVDPGRGRSGRLRVVVDVGGGDAATERGDDRAQPVDGGAHVVGPHAGVGLDGDLLARDLGRRRHDARARRRCLAAVAASSSASAWASSPPPAATVVAAPPAVTVAAALSPSPASSSVAGCSTPGQGDEDHRTSSEQVATRAWMWAPHGDETPGRAPRFPCRSHLPSSARAVRPGHPRRADAAAADLPRGGRGGGPGRRGSVERVLRRRRAVVERGGDAP